MSDQRRVKLDEVCTAEGAALEIRSAVDTPALLVDIERVQANLDDMAGFCRARNVSLVPHTKTHRTPEFAQMQVETGADALCIAKLGEAEILSQAGFHEFVMAYPIVGELKYDRAKRLLRQGTHIRFTTDHHEPAEAFGASCDSEGLTADITIKVDTGFHRVGLTPSRALDLALHLNSTAGLRVQGFICHEGHAAGAAAYEECHSLSLDTGATMAALLTDLQVAGVDASVASVGSTATAKTTALAVGVTEVRPGIYPFNDLGQVVRGTVGIERCAARVLTTVVSNPTPGRAVVDAGSKAMGQDLLSVWFKNGGGGHGLIVGHPGWEIFQLSEEHGWMRWVGVDSPTPMPVGTELQILPNHICSVFHALGRSVILRNGECDGEWTATARGGSQ